MFEQSLTHTYKRYRTLQTDRISALPIVILMPHSACNCKCVMCDIWKDNKNLRQLHPDDVQKLISSLRKLETREVVMSGGEALLNPNFFILCRILKKENIKVTLLSTGLLLKKHATDLIENVNEIIVSLDGDEQTHDAIRNIPGAYNKLKEGIHFIKSMVPQYRISGRTVIHQLNFRKWLNIIDSAKEIGLNSISFLPADVSSHAFNREQLWDASRQGEIMLRPEDLPGMKTIIEQMASAYKNDFERKFIAESEEKIMNIYRYYAAFYQLNPFPYKKCNAPWVSAVIEADGNVRPCFFHPVMGNIHDDTLSGIVNNSRSLAFRKSLDIGTNDICVRCVCSLNLPPGKKL